MNGKTTSAKPCAACAETGDHAHEQEHPLEDEAEEQDEAAAASAAPQLPCRRNPTRKPIATVTASPQTWMPVSASARPISTALRGIGSERRRAISPASMSSAMPADGVHGVEEHAGGDEPGDDEVDVVDAAGVMAPPKT